MCKAVFTGKLCAHYPCTVCVPSTVHMPTALPSPIFCPTETYRLCMALLFVFWVEGLIVFELGYLASCNPALYGFYLL